MPKPHIITALDIGSNSIKLISAFKKSRTGNFDIAGQAQDLSAGIRKGVVVDVNKVSETIACLIKNVEEESKHKIKGVYVNIDGGHISCNCSRGLVSVSRADRKISEEDVDRVVQAAKTFSLPSNKEIIDTFPKEFIVDGQGGIREPVGMEGVRLEAEVLILHCFSPYLKNSSQAVLNAGRQINDLIPGPLASSQAVLTPREKELGVMLLDIGGGTTGMTIFEEECLNDFAIFPVGSSHITNDIAICLKTDIDTAEKIKLEFGKYSSKSSGSKASRKKVKLEGEEPLIFSPKTLNDIIEARVCEIFNLINKELKRVSRQGLLPAGVVLTGGGANLPGIKELAKKELKLPCRIGLPTRFSSLAEDPSFSAICGLIMMGSELEEEDGGGFSSFRSGVARGIKRFFKIFIP